jgi:hypothetical protein
MTADFDINVNSESLKDIWTALFDAIILKQPLKVFTASVDHKHGVNTYMARSEDGTYEELHEYVQEGWEEIESDVAFANEVDGFPIPEDHKEAVELYFEHHPNEYLSIEDTELLP